MLLSYESQAKGVENICNKHLRLLASAANFGACCPHDLEGNISENIVPSTLSMSQVAQWDPLTKLSVNIHL